MKVVERWLSSAGRNFLVGKTLYQTFGTDISILRRLDAGESPDNRILLEKALRGLTSAKIPAPAARPAAEPIPAPKPAAPQSHPDVMPDSEDPVLLALKREWMQPYQEMNMLRHRLHAFGSANDPNAISSRQEIAFKILELEQSCMAIWQKRDHYLQHKTLPEIKTMAFEKPTDPLELGRMVEATKRRIREWRKKSLQDPADPKAAQTLAEYRNKYFLLTGTQYQDKE